MKQLILNLILTISAIIGLTNCNNKTIGTEIQQLSPEAISFLNYYSQNYEAITTKSIIPTVEAKGKTRKIKDNNDMVTVYVDYPTDTSTPIKELCNIVATAQDISALHRLTAAEFSTTNGTGTEYSITLSTDEIRKALSPLIEEGKRYLYSQGMSEQEIQDMLTENHTDETQIAPFILMLVNYECMENKLAKNEQNSINSLSNLFATPCTASNNAFLEAAFDCGMEAIGVDFLFAAGTSQIKSWSKPLIKRAFKAVAQKALGPIGAIIAVANFGWCMHRRGYICIYAVSTPVEDEFNKLKDKGLEETPFTEKDASTFP